MTNSMHPDHRELGFGNAEARPDVDGTQGPTKSHGGENSGDSGGAGAGQSGGGESGGGARPEPVETTDGKGSPGGQTDPAYRGGDNPNAPRR